MRFMSDERRGLFAFAFLLASNAWVLVVVQNLLTLSHTSPFPFRPPLLLCR